MSELEESLLLAMKKNIELAHQLQELIAAAMSVRAQLLSNARAPKAEVNMACADTLTKALHIKEQTPITRGF